jgi:peptidoglycan/xylan/chitin deacetylase (PgdA/CDA1 family)
LAIAGAAQARITIMAIGTWVNQNPALVKQFVAAGHELGNHTWTHPVLSDLGRADVQSEIVRCRAELIGVAGTPGTYFRQSGAQYSTGLIRDVAGAAGYRICLSYDIDSLDWTDPGPAAIRRNAAAATKGSIVSLHLGHPGTVEALPGILDDLAHRGLRAVTAHTLLAA